MLLYSVMDVTWLCTRVRPRTLDHFDFVVDIPQIAMAFPTSLRANGSVENVRFPRRLPW